MSIDRPADDYTSVGIQDSATVDFSFSALMFSNIGEPGLVMSFYYKTPFHKVSTRRNID